jgi:hypothetical protein
LTTTPLQLLSVTVPASPASFFQWTRAPIFSFLDWSPIMHTAFQGTLFPFLPEKTTCAGPERRGSTAFSLTPVVRKNHFQRQVVYP